MKAAPLIPAKIPTRWDKTLYIENEIYFGVTPAIL
jgi:hypothetical protein